MARPSDRLCQDGGALDGVESTCDLPQGHEPPCVDLYEGHTW